MNFKKLRENINKAYAINNIKVCLYNPKKIKPRPDKHDELFSEDVYTIDENGLNGLACFCFKTNQWKFHTDMTEDYNNLKLNIIWWWFYPPIKVSDISR